MQRNTRGLTAAGCLSAILAILLNGCSPSHDNAPKINLEPVRDTAPYWCQLVPQVSVRDVTGVRQALRQDRDVNLSSSLSTCEVGDETQLPLEVQLALSAEAKFQEKQEFAHNRSEMALPLELGHAIFRTSPEAPNYSIASRFHCGDNAVWIEIVVRAIQVGRNPKIDLPAFLKIAENRYASLAKCQIKTPVPTKS
jgi:hypothetical protein